MQNYWAVITGATSGLGEVYSRVLASRGVNLLVTGRREHLLHALAGELKNRHGVEVEVAVGDLSEMETVDDIVARAMQGKRLKYLVCNAGYGSKSDFLDDSIQSEEKMVKVHVEATIRLCHALAPRIEKPQGAGNGGIILVSSLAAFLSSANSVMYCSTKAFLNSFAKSLALLMYDRGIPVQALCPGYTRTEFHAKLDIPAENLKNKGFVRWMSAAKVVDVSLKNLKPGKVIVVPGVLNRGVKIISFLIPFWLYVKIVPAKGKIFK